MRKKRGMDLEIKNEKLGDAQDSKMKSIQGKIHALQTHIATQAAKP